MLRSPDTLRVMTYNVHGCIGMDGDHDPERIARVIESLRPDVVALQELDVDRARSRRLDQPAWLAARLGFHVHFTLARICAEDSGRYGNAVLARWPMELRSEGGLPGNGGELRAVQWLRVQAPRETLDVLNTHLGLGFCERLLQVEALLSTEWLAHEQRSDALVVCGDFNSGPWSPVYRRLTRDLQDGPRAAGRRYCRTWPSRAPFLRLDYVFLSKRARVTACEVPTDARSRVASDHLPVLVEFELTPRAESSP